MEPPECPVCLQPYDAVSAIPRVLSCGHSACEACLDRLPRQFPDTVRCPACTQIVPMARPSALPKNIDLLRIIESVTSDGVPGCREQRNRLAGAVMPAPIEFIRQPWDQEFYRAWKDYLIPSDAVVLMDGDEEVDWCRLWFGRLDASKYSSSSLRSDQKVSLLLLADLHQKESEFIHSYMSRVVGALHRMKSEDRDELSYVIRSVSKYRNLCKIFGLWLDSGKNLLFLVSERCEGDISEIMAKLKFSEVDSVPIFAMAGLEICESIISLHSEGLICGIFTLSCFRFNEFGRFLADMNEIFVAGRRCWKTRMGQKSSVSELFNTETFIGPEVQVSEGSERIGRYESDIWSLACLFCRILIGNEFDDKGLKPLCVSPQIKIEESSKIIFESYNVWIDQFKSSPISLLPKEFGKILTVLCQCLDLNPTRRPHMIDLWKCFRACLVVPRVDIVLGCEIPTSVNMVFCLILGSLCHVSERNKCGLSDFQETNLRSLHACKLEDAPKEDLEGSPMIVHRDVVDALPEGRFESFTLEGHLDCITGLAVVGGFLFSSSFDKSVHMWSLQDFSLVKVFRGHEHRVTAVVVVNAENPLCISGDSGRMICVWEIDNHQRTDPLRKWNDHDEWRYSGVHSLTVSGTEFLYSGSGDKSIKAWSLKDYTLSAIMTGHKSVVSSLAVSGGILYSGSWDGTVRLWWLNDHSPLSVLGEETAGSAISLLSLSVYSGLLAASHENGCIKIWKNDSLVHSTQTHTGAIFSVSLAEKFLFTGGWNGIIDVQEWEENESEVHTKPVGSIACPAVVTALLYWKGKLIAGFSDKTMKVYLYDSRSEMESL